MFKKYVIMREHRFDFGAPIEIHYYTSTTTTKNINEAKRFFTKKGAYKWLRKNYSRVENYFTDRCWFALINLKKKSEKDKSK